MLKQQSKYLSHVQRMIDFLLVIMAGFIAYWLRFGCVMPHSSKYYFAIFFGAIIGFFCLYYMRIYSAYRARSLTIFILRLIAAWIVLVLIWTFIVFYTKTGSTYSRLWLFYWVIISFLLIALFHMIVFAFLRAARSRGYNIRSVAVIGTGPVVSDLVQKTTNSRWMGYVVKNIFANDIVDLERSIHGHKISSMPANLESFVLKKHIDEIWIALPFTDFEKIKTIFNDLRYSTVNIKLMPSINDFEILNHSISEISGIPVINLRESPMHGENRYLKSVEDKLLSFGILVLISPVMLIIACFIKLTSPGPIFYKQERVSWNGKIFKIMKFRSMPVEAESSSGAVWAVSGENRATKIGKFLRKTSLDELPQFINVLKGEMSIVGPRPERPVFVEQFKKEIPGYMQKHMVKAGITGWAQVNGFRGDTDLKLRIKHDLYYIDHWSLWFDLKILCLTVVKGFVSKNAY